MENYYVDSFVLEQDGIGLKNEKSLHAAIKQWYVKKGDRLEVKVEGYVADILRDDIIIEIQTKNFSAIGKKLRKLTDEHRIILVHPIAVEKWIVKKAVDGSELTRRKSPKRGQVYHLFNELIRIPDLINKPNFALEILLINAEEVQVDDGKGSWRRKGHSIEDRRLLEVLDRVLFFNKEQFIALIPTSLERPFTNKTLAKALKLQLRLAQKMTYCLRKMDGIEEVYKKGNELFFDVKHEE